MSSSPDLAPDAARHLALGKLAEEVNARLASGQDPDVAALIGRYPDLDSQIRQLVPALATLNDLGQPASVSDGPTPGQGTGPGRIGDYQIIRELGRGGMGVVYEAEQISLGRRVALKVLPFAAILDERQLTRFKNEARVAATLNHPNIVAVHAVGHADGVHFFVMQLIEGLSVAEVIEELKQVANESGEAPHSSPLSDISAHLSCPSPGRSIPHGGADSPLQTSGHDPTIDHTPSDGQSFSATSSRSHDRMRSETVRATSAALSTERSQPRFTDYCRNVAGLGIQVAQALDYAHEHGVVHRDIKPANLMMDTSSRVWVADFGLARLTNDAGMTMTGDLMGTLRYMSPEQALAKRVAIDHRTDLYSLGATLYELLALRPVFDGEDRQVLLRQVAFEEPTPLRRIKRAIPAELETIILKTISKNPEDRYASAQDLADDLQRFLDYKPIKAQPPTMADHMFKWSRRHQGLVLATSVILVLITVGLAISTTLIWAENQKTVGALGLAKQNEQHAEKARKEAQVSADEAEAVVDFLVNDLLASASPLESPGRKITVEEVLANANERIDDAFQDQPLVEATIRLATAKTLRHLAKYDQAERHTERALKLREQFLGPEHPKTLRAMNDLGLTFWKQDRLPEARELLETTIRLKTRVSGANHKSTMVAKANLALVLVQQDEFESAQKLMEEVYEFERRELGMDDPRVLGSLLNLGVVLRRQNRLDEALQLYQRELPHFREILNPDHPLIVMLRTNIALILSKQGHQADAREILEQVIATGTRVLGEDHDDVLKAIGNLALTYSREGNNEKAAELREQALAGFRRTFGPEHRSTLEMLEDLAHTRKRNDQPEVAIPLYKELLAIELRVLGAENPETLQTMNNLASALNTVERRDEAEDYYRRVHDIHQKRWLDHPDDTRNAIALGGVMCNLGNLIVSDSKWNEAQPWYDSAIRVLTTVTDNVTDEREAVRAQQYLENSLVGRARTLALMGHHRKATAESLAALEASETLRHYYNLACIFSLAAKAAANDDELTSEQREELSEEYSRRAISWLEKSEYVHDPSNIDLVRSDSDLDPLRARQDFQKVLDR